MKEWVRASSSFEPSTLLCTTATAGHGFIASDTASAPFTCISVATHFHTPPSSLLCVGTSDWWTRSGTWSSWKLSQQAWVVFSEISSLSWLATWLHSACAPPQYKDQRPLNLEVLPLTSRRGTGCLTHRGQHRHSGSRCETGFVQLQQEQGRLQRVAQEWSHLW